MAAAIFRLFIINKSGGLIFYKDYGSAGRMDTNDSLRLASLWHSMHAISQQLSPTVGCSGIELLEADSFDLHCFQSLTGVVTQAHQSFTLKIQQGFHDIAEGLYRFRYDHEFVDWMKWMVIPIAKKMGDQISLGHAIWKHIL
ncbi:hypothetical protein IFM89_020926 [Coptis chinensis]|uniref:Trafficking protein particle complex subunit n=1 Tax=Coptis chinensis TaxID=261450 RepID=A0A835IQB1_9MAGN|nr:hypothetical protein IFM89_020926 [Coptis chinensis]